MMAEQTSNPQAEGKRTKNSNYIVVCSKHFTIYCFRRPPGLDKPPLLKQGVVPNNVIFYPKHLQPPAVTRRRVLVRNTPPSTNDLPTQSEHRTPESKSVKAPTLTYVLLNNIHTKFTCAIHSTELIKTIINRYALIRIKYETTKMIPKQDNMRQKLSRLIVFSHI